MGDPVAGGSLPMAGRRVAEGRALSRVVAVTVPGRVVTDEVAGLDVDEVRAVVVAADLPSELCAIDPFGEWLHRDRFEDILAKFSKAGLHKTARIGGCRLPGRQSRWPPACADSNFVETSVGPPQEQPHPRRCAPEQFLAQENLRPSSAVPAYGTW